MVGQRSVMVGQMPHHAHPIATPLPCSTSLLLASNNICFQKSSDMLNKNTLGVKKVRGQSEAALQTGATKNFDIS